MKLRTGPTQVWEIIPATQPLKLTGLISALKAAYQNVSHKIDEDRVKARKLWVVNVQQPIPNIGGIFQQLTENKMQKVQMSWERFKNICNSWGINGARSTKHFLKLLSFHYLRSPLFCSVIYLYFYIPACLPVYHNWHPKLPTKWLKLKKY